MDGMQMLGPLLDALVEMIAEKVAERLRGAERTRASALLSKQGLATALVVSTATVDRLVRESRIPFFLVGDSRRFDLGEVRAALRAPPDKPVLDPQPMPSSAPLVRYGRRRGTP